MRFALGMATGGLAIHLFLWSIPAVVAAATVPHALFTDTAPTLANALASTQGVQQKNDLPDALVQRIAAESEALDVAGQGLHTPPPANLAEQATHAGNRVKSALVVYINAAQNTLRH